LRENLFGHNIQDIIKSSVVKWRW